MKDQKNIQWLAGLALATVACCLPGIATAQPQVYYPQPSYYYAVPDTGFYFGAGIGPSFMQNFQSSRFGYPSSFSPRTGVRMGIEPGINFISTPYLTFAGEFETGFSYNYLSSISQPGSPNAYRGDYYQVPLLGSLILKLKTPSIVEPYIGIGGGGDYSSAGIRDHYGYYGYGYYGHETYNDQIDPAVQGTVGLRFLINPVSDVGIGYKFLADFPGGGRTINTHSIEASFTWRF